MHIHGDIGGVAVDILQHLDQKDPGFKHVLLTDSDKSHLYPFLMNGYVPMHDAEITEQLGVAVDGLHRIGDAMIYKVPIDKWREIQDYYTQQDYVLREQIREQAPVVAAGPDRSMAGYYSQQPEGEPKSIGLPKVVRGRREG